MSIETTDEKFETDVLLCTDKPVLVDFWAEWCGPCRQLLPIVEEISIEMTDRIKLVKVNIDNNPEIPAKYGVRGIPTLMLFHMGKNISTKVGALPKSSLIEWIEENI